MYFLIITIELEIYIYIYIYIYKHIKFLKAFLFVFFKTLAFQFLFISKWIDCLFSMFCVAMECVVVDVVPRGFVEYCKLISLVFVHQVFNKK